MLLGCLRQSDEVCHISDEGVRLLPRGGFREDPDPGFGAGEAKDHPAVPEIDFA